MIAFIYTKPRKSLSALLIFSLLFSLALPLNVILANDDYDDHLVPPTISKTADKTTATPGDFIIYTITVNNPNSVEFEFVHFQDQLPVTVVFDHFISNPGTTTESGLIIWPYIFIRPSETVVYQYVVKIKNDVTDGTIITNNATSRYCFVYDCHQSSDVSASVLVTIPTNHAPIITLLGDNPMIVLENSVFTDPGATATDTEDGDLTAQIVKTGSVNTSITGDYTLTYSATDSDGASVSVNRIVTVIPTSECEIIIVSDINTKLNNGSNSVPTYAGNSRWTASIPDATWIWKSFYVEHPEQDEFTTFIREFNISASTSVTTFVVAADNSYTVSINGTEVGSDSTEFNYFDEEKDSYDLTDFIRQGQNQISFIVKNWGNVDSTPEGNPAGLLFKLSVGLRKEECIANTAPTIHLIGDNPLNLFVGDSFIDPGATATDTEDGDLTSHIVVTGSVNTSTISTSTLIYSITDSGGLLASTTRIVIVLATSTATTTPPTSTTTPPVVNPPINPPSNNSGGDSGGGGGGMGGHRRDISHLLSTTTIIGGQVLGIISCSYLRDYMRRDWNNDPMEVLKLQSFLNVFEKENLSYTTVFDEPTFQAVSRFQNKYFNDILAPWGHTAPTGFVYILTKKKINEIYCNTIYPLTTEQQSEITTFKAYLLSLRNGGTELPNVSETVGIDNTKEKVAKTDEEEKGVLSNNILHNAAISLFAIPKNLPISFKWLFIFLIALAAIYAVYSFLNSNKEKDKTKRKKFDANLPPATISYDKSLEELVNEIVKKEELKEVKEKEDSKKGFKGILDE